MPTPRLNVVVTRRLPPAVETRMKELFDVELRDPDTRMTRDELASAMQRCDVLVPTLTDAIDTAMLAQAGTRLKLIANYGAGVDHIDVASARQRGICPPAMEMVYSPSPGGNGRTYTSRRPLLTDTNAIQWLSGESWEK